MLLAGALLTVIMGLAARPMGLDSALDALLPAHSPALQAQQALRRRLGRTDVLVITLHTDELPRVKAGLAAVAAALTAHKDIRAVEWHLDLDALRRNALVLLPSTAELERAAAWITEVVQDQIRAAVGLLDPPEPAATSDPSPGDRAAPLQRLADELSQANEGDREYFEALGGRVISLLAFPTQSPRDVSFSRRLLRDVRPVIETAIRAHIGPVGPDGPVKTIRFSGRYESIQSESAGLWRQVGFVAPPLLALWLILLGAYLRRRVALAVVLAPTLMAAISAAGIASFTVTRLDLMSVAIFPLIFIQGLANGLYLWRTYGEGRRHGWSPDEAVSALMVGPVRRCVVAAVSVAGAMALLTLSDLPGLARLGGLGAAGALLGALGAALITPALLTAWPPARPAGPPLPTPSAPAPGLILTFVALLGAAWATPKLEINTDLQQMGPGSAGRQAISLLQTGAPSVRAPVVILARSAEEAESIRARLPLGADRRGSTLLAGAAALSDVLPPDQDRRLAAARRLCKWLSRKRGLIPGIDDGQLGTLMRYCDPRPMTLGDLPGWLRRQFTDTQGRVGAHLFLFPRGSSLDGARALKLQALVDDLRGEDGERPLAAGAPFVLAEIIDLLQGDVWLLLSAPILLWVLVTALTLRPRYSLTVVAPLVVASGLMACLLVLTHRPLALFDLLLWPSAVALAMSLGGQRAGGDPPWLLGALLLPPAGALTLLNHGGLASGGQILVLSVITVVIAEWALRGIAGISRFNRRRSEGER